MKIAPSPIIITQEHSSKLIDELKSKAMYDRADYVAAMQARIEKLENKINGSELFKLRCIHGFVNCGTCGSPDNPRINYFEAATKQIDDAQRTLNAKRGAKS